MECQLISLVEKICCQGAHYINAPPEQFRVTLGHEQLTIIFGHIQWQFQYLQELTTLLCDPLLERKGTSQRG